MKHTKKRVAALLLTLAMVLSLMPAAFAADTDFPDMPAEDDASYAAVKSAVDNEIMTGENGMLNLEGHILRSTVSKMVVTAFAAKGEADLSDYPDVVDGAWYAEWMAKANQMGIMSGTSGKMRPSDEVTLQEVATMLVRALGLEPGTEADLEGVPGAEDVAAWAIPFVAALVKANYISDVTGANQPMTRVAFAEVIYKVSGEGNYVKEAGEITEDVDGNIVITAEGVSLKGITVKGDVIIADGVDAGSINLDGVTIEGRLVVRGGAEASLTNGTTASATVVAKTSGEITVKADDSSNTGAIDVAGTNSKAPEKVTLDMAEPNATISTDTAVAVQNAKGGEVTMASANVSLTVESGTLDNVIVSDGMNEAKVEVAAGATIENITTNTDITVTGEGTVSEVTGSGVVSDESGEVIGGGDEEPADVPTVSDTSNPVDPNAPTKAEHTHNYATTGDDAVITNFDATRHTVECVGEDGCGAVIYVGHSHTESENTACICGATKPADPTTSAVTAGDKACSGEHVWANVDDGKVNLTCTVDGVQKQQCTNMVPGEGDAAATRCTATRTITTPATGHNLVPFKTEAATCNVDGKTYFKCSNADCTEGEDDSVYTTIPATGNHTWKQLAPTAATCAAGGHYNYKCTVCNTTDDTKPIAKDPNAHSYNITNNGDGTHTLACANKATCHAEDKTVQCSMIAKADGTAAKAPTCNTKGATGDKICSVAGCGYEIASEEIPATGKHTFKSTWESNASGHWHKCETCSTYNAAPSSDENKAAASYAEHTWSKMDGENPATGAQCTVCGYTNGSGSGSGSETTTHTHVWSNGVCTSTTGLAEGVEKCTETHNCTDFDTVAAKAATCVATGTTEKKTCKTCGKVTGGDTVGIDSSNHAGDNVADGKCDACKGD